MNKKIQLQINILLGSCEITFPITENYYILLALSVVAPALFCNLFSRYILLLFHFIVAYRKCTKFIIAFLCFPLYRNMDCLLICFGFRKANKGIERIWFKHVQLLVHFYFGEYLVNFF